MENWLKKHTSLNSLAFWWLTAKSVIYASEWRAPQHGELGHRNLSRALTLTQSAQTILVAVSLRMRLAGHEQTATAMLAIDWSCCSASIAVQTDGCAWPTSCRKPLFQLSHSLLVRCWLFRVASNTFQVTGGNIGGMRRRRTCSPFNTDPVAAGRLIRRAVPFTHVRDVPSKYAINAQSSSESCGMLSSRKAMPALTSTGRKARASSDCIIISSVRSVNHQ